MSLNANEEMLASNADADDSYPEYQPYYCNNLIQKLTNLFDAFRMIFNTRINAHLHNFFLKGINVKKLIMDMYFIIYSIKTEG